MNTNIIPIDIDNLNNNNTATILTGADAGVGTKKKQARCFMKRLRAATGVPLPVAARIAKKFVRDPWAKAQWSKNIPYEGISLVAIRGTEYDEVYLVVRGPRGTAAMYA